MYTLRIIDQTENGGEKRRNIFLGKNYDILMKIQSTKTSNDKEVERKNVFNTAIQDFYSPDTQHKCNEDGTIDSNIVGFVYAESITCIKKHEVAYIVNSEGKTIERIYGIYEKY